MRVTCTVPEPVKVPVPLMIFDAPGVRTTVFATVNVPDALMFRFTLNPLVLFTFTVLKAMVALVVPLIDRAAATVGALKLTVLEVVYANGVAADVLTIH